MAVRGRKNKKQTADGSCNWCEHAMLNGSITYTLVDLKITREFCPKGKCYELGVKRMVTWALKREQDAQRNEDNISL